VPQGESLTILDCDHRDAEQDAEQHDRGNDVVGERVKGIDRQVEAEEVELLGSLHQARAEVGARFPGRKREGYDDDRQQRDHPEREQHHAGAACQIPRLLEAEATDLRDQRNGHVGQDGHLEQTDVDVSKDLERRALLAQEDPDRDTAEDPDEDPGPQRELARAVRLLLRHEALLGPS
jgi:hypothetical protein